jgi:hypothetical protein
MPDISSFGAVVMMAQLRIGEPSGDCHSSHNPAKANISVAFVMHAHRLLARVFAAAFALPFVESVGGNKAATAQQALLKPAFRPAFRHAR